MSNREVSIKDFINTSDIVRHADEIDKCLVAGRALQECLEVSDEQVNKIYHFAHNLIQNHDHENAQKMFAYLLVLNSFDSRFWKSMGISYSLEGEHLPAVECFAIAAMIEPRKGENYLWMGLDFVKMDHHEEALKALRLAREKGYGAVQSNAEAVLDALAEKDLESIDALYHKQFKMRVESLGMENIDPVLSRRERQRAVYCQVKHKVMNPLPREYPRYVREFIGGFAKEHEGNLISFCLSFLSQGKGAGIHSRRNFG